MPRFMLFAHARADPDEVDVELDETAPLAERNRELAESMGMDLVEAYYLTSKYFSVSIVDAPDYETVATAIREATSPGSTLQVEAVPAFTAEEVE